MNRRRLSVSLKANLTRNGQNQVIVFSLSVIELKASDKKKQAWTWVASQWLVHVMVWREESGSHLNFDLNQTSEAHLVVILAKQERLVKKLSFLAQVHSFLWRQIQEMENCYWSQRVLGIFNAFIKWRKWNKIVQSLILKGTFRKFNTMHRA